MAEETFFNVRVDCYAGYRGDETPRQFWLGDKKIKVAGISDRWLAPDHRYFKVNADDGAVYILRHDIERQVWELILFDGSRE